MDGSKALFAAHLNSGLSKRIRGYNIYPVLEDVMQCWRILCKGASVLTISMGPEYPGLDESVLLEGSGVPLED
jgi:hypothetical protein